jgi:hypothetical protein
MKTAFLALVALAFLAVPADAQTTVTCESPDGRFHECRLEGAGVATLTRQMSDRDCIEGRTWDYRDGKIWVDKGCRGEFTLARRGPGSLSAPIFAPALPTSTFVCESVGGRRNHCRADTMYGAILVRQTSDSTCQMGSTWGIDQNGVWVTRGCRAEFMTVDPRRSQGISVGTIVCESTDGKHKHCPADTRYGVRLVRQLSDTRCDRNRSWGFDDVGVWVTNGCRAEFALDRR